MKAKKLESSLKISVLGVLLYFSPTKRRFYALAKKWFPDPKIPGGLTKRINVMKYNFWKSVLSIFVLIVLVLGIQFYFFNAEFSTKHWLQVAGVFIALTATLGRAGWGIQSMEGNTIFERIERGMYVISQLGATCILLFVLIF